MLLRNEIAKMQKCVQTESEKLNVESGKDESEKFE